MTRKRMMKMLMSRGVPRNTARALADADRQSMLPRGTVCGAYLASDNFRDIFDLFMPQILKGATVTITN